MGTERLRSGRFTRVPVHSFDFASAKPESSFSILMEAESGWQRSQTGRRSRGRQRKRNTSGLNVAPCTQNMEYQYWPRWPFPYTLTHIPASKHQGLSLVSCFCFLQPCTLGFSALPAAVLFTVAWTVYAPTPLSKLFWIILIQRSCSQI